MEGLMQQNTVYSNEQWQQQMGLLTL